MLASLVALLLLAGVPTPAAPAPPASLLVEHRTIFTFTTGLGDVPPAERARLAQERIEGMPLQVADEPITVRSHRLGDIAGHAVLVGGRLAFSITEGDVDAAEGQTTEAAATAAAARLGEALRARRDQRSPAVLVRGLLRSGIATVALALALWLLLRLRALRTDSLRQLAEAGSHGLSTRGIDLRPLLRALGRGLLHLASWGLVALLLDLYLTFVLASFPATRPWADAMTGRVVGAFARLGLEALAGIPGLAAAALILVVADSVTRFLGGAFDRVAAGSLALPGLYPETVGATRRITVALVWFAALVAAWPYLPGSDSEAFKGLGLLVGVMVSLGSTSVVSQAMSGLVVIYSRALAKGDYIRSGDVEGVVTEVGLVSTKVTTMRGEEVTLPHNVAVSGGIKNFTRLAGGQGPLVSTTVTIGYDAPWRTVESLLLAAARATPGLRQETAPFVLQRALSDFYVEYELVARLVDPMERPQVLSVLHANIQDGFNQAGVQIMSPHFVVQPGSPVLGRG